MGRSGGSKRDRRSRSGKRFVGKPVNKHSSLKRDEIGTKIPKKRSKGVEEVSVYKRPVEYPKPCPSVSSDSQCFVDPSSATAFQALMETAYKGFVKDSADAYDSGFHSSFRRALEGLQRDDFFQFDFTQPAGLGAKLAKTYVTRCLVGEPGITYKYLGLRMFAHPWDSDATGATEWTAAVKVANTSMVQRSRHLLQGLQRTHVGATDYNLTLINKCFPACAVRLKDEPYYSSSSSSSRSGGGGAGGGKEKCSVSWHADSSLEHFSSIGVYQCLHDDDDNNESVGGKSKSKSGAPNDAEPSQHWRVALRVEHDAEGPTSKLLKSKRSGSSVNSGGKHTPPVAVPLLDGESYHLLDDFNHHHQHCVLAGSSHRWASTHRVGRRDGHTFDWILKVCRTAINSGVRNTPKSLRAEQHALHEVESEWLRQFYIQGRKHYDLHTWWHAPLDELKQAWRQLERRTMQSIEDLECAAKGGAGVLTTDAEMNGEKVGGGEGDGDDEDEEKRKRKKQQKQRKRLLTVESASYDVLRDALQIRLDMRRGWSLREKDQVFNSVDPCCRPLPFAVIFKESEYISIGGFGGDFKKMERIIQSLEEWKQDFERLQLHKGS